MRKNNLLLDKGGSHVGLILSFVVFVTFLFFILNVLNPAVKQRGDKQLELDLLKLNLFEKLNSNLSVTSIKVKNETAYAASCFIIDNPFNNSVKVKDEENVLVSGFSFDSDKKIQIAPFGKKFFKIFSSPNFVDAQTSPDSNCEVLSSDNYTLGATRTDRYIFEDGLLNLLAEYDENYTLLKKELGVSENNEFGILFVNSTGEEIQRGFQQVSGNVYIDEIPVQYYNLDAEIQAGSIKIRVW